MLRRYEKFLSLLIAKRKSSNVVTLRNSTSHWLYRNQEGALVKEIFRNSELLELCHLERYEWSKVNLYPPFFSFAHAPKLLRRRASLSSYHESKKHYIGSSRIITYYSPALFLLIEGFCMRSDQFWFNLKLGR